MTLGSQKRLQEKVGEILLLTKEEFIAPYLVEMVLGYLNEHGLCYYMLLRPIKSRIRTVLVRKDGSIANFCRGFGRDMDLVPMKNQFLSIYDFCSELKEIFESIKERRNIQFDGNMNSLDSER